ALALIDQTIDAIHHAAIQPTQNDIIAPVQRLYANALAWRAVARMMGSVSEHELSEPGVCGVSIRLRRGGEDFARYYPTHAADVGQQGVVVLRVILDASNSASRVDVVATAPGQI